MELILLPLLFGIISFFIPSKFVRTTSILFATTTAVATGIRLYSFQIHHVLQNYIFYLGKPFNQGLSFQMGYNGIGILMLALCSLVILLVALSNYQREEAKSPLFVGLMFLMQFGLNGVFASEDGVLFYVFWEFTLIPVFLMLYWFGKQENKPTLLKFFLYTLFGSLFMLLSIISLSIYSSDKFDYNSLMNTVVPAKYACWIFTGFLVAFAVKVPIFPLHTWQPNTYSSAPMAGTMLLSAIMLKMALFGMIKWMIALNYNAMSFWKWPVIVLGVVGILYGAFIAMRENNLRKVFAYASISHLGLIVAGIMIFSLESLQGSMIQIFNHSLVAIGLFLAAGIIEDRTGTSDLNELGGIAKLAPRFGFWFGVIMLISLSVPLTAGFIGEFLLIKSVFDFNMWLGILSALTLVIGAVYMIRAYQMSSMGAPKMTSFMDLKWNETIVFSVIAILALVIGLFPEIILSFVKPSITSLLQSVQGAHTTIK